VDCTSTEGTQSQLGDRGVAVGEVEEQSGREGSERGHRVRTCALCDPSHTGVGMRTCAFHSSERLNCAGAHSHPIPRLLLGVRTSERTPRLATARAVISFAGMPPAREQRRRSMAGCTQSSQACAEAWGRSWRPTTLNPLSEAHFIRSRSSMIPRMSLNGA
jgi:hypothetical protein